MFLESPAHNCFVIPSLFRKKDSIKSIHIFIFIIIIKQADHDQTGFNLNELVFGRIKFSVNGFLHHHTCPRYPGRGEQQIDTTFDDWFRTKWIKNESTCLWRQSGPTLIFICPRSYIDFYIPAASII